MSLAFDVDAVIGGTLRSRAEVLAWEDRRISVSARRLGVEVPPGQEVARRREQLVQAKLALGADAVLTRFAGQLRTTDRTARLVTRMRGRAFVTAELHVTGCGAQHFVDWLDDRLRADDRAAMLRACPDHYVLCTREDGTQHVVQASGAAPMLNQFFLTYGDESGLVTPREPRYTHQVTATARLGDGTPVGGARMQFSDTATGFTARLVEEFPRLTPGFLLAQQRWHTALEFSNWAQAASDV